MSSAIDLMDLLMSKKISYVTIVCGVAPRF